MCNWHRTPSESVISLTTISSHSSECLCPMARYTAPTSLSSFPLSSLPHPPSPFSPFSPPPPPTLPYLPPLLFLTGVSWTRNISSSHLKIQSWTRFPFEVWSRSELALQSSPGEGLGILPFIFAFVVHSDSPPASLPPPPPLK